MPEGGAVGDGVVDGDTDEDGVGELGDLDGEEREVVAGEGDGFVEGEEFFEGIGEGGGEVFGGGVEEEDAGVVAEDVEVAEGVGDEAAGERGEERESKRERAF